MAKKKKKAAAKRITRKTKPAARGSKKIAKPKAKKAGKKSAKKSGKKSAKKSAPRSSRKSAQKSAPAKKGHPAGTFSWMELRTTDIRGAKDFYKSMFGWQFEDMPMPGDDSQKYTTVSLRGGAVAGMSQPTAEQMGEMPPHWGLYVSVDDVDATVAKSTKLGGKAIMPAFDIPNVGRMAMLQDPAGAMIAVWWNRSQNPGFGAVGNKLGNYGEAGTFCWGELLTGDTAGSEAFYTKLFGWKSKTSANDDGEYTEFQVGGHSIGGMMTFPPDAPRMPPNWGMYVAVKDCDASVEIAKQHGARVLMGPMDIPETGRFAVIQDPQGAVFSVIKVVLARPM